MTYDLIVIGGGPGGYTGAIRAAKLGMKTALIEEADLGGTCLNRGCIPTKALLHSGEIFTSRNEWADKGIRADNVTLDENKIYARKQKIVESLRGGVENLIKANGIDLYKEHGFIVDGETVKAGETLLKTKFILIATGSRPMGFDPQRPLKGIENALASDDVLSKPIGGNSVIIIGGGVIAVEFASYFKSTGRAVTLLVSGDRILRAMSKDISTKLSAELKRAGIKIVTNAKIKEITKTSAVYTDESGAELCASADAVIAAVGRANNLSGIGLENIGLKLDKILKVDDNMYTGVMNVYACGDITGRAQLAHYATASAITAVESMLDKKHSMNLKIVPSCIYTRPEIAVAGKTEPEVENAKIGKFLMGGNGKCMIEGQTRGYVKVICDQNDKVVGAELFCIRATDMIGELALAIEKGMTAEQAAAVIHPHPTVMESAGEALEDVLGLATHAASVKCRV